MEAEYIDLSHCMPELILLWRLTREVGEAFGVPEGDKAIHSVMFEDNTGAVALAKVPKMPLFPLAQIGLKTERD